MSLRQNHADYFAVTDLSADEKRAKSFNLGVIDFNVVRSIYDERFDDAYRELWSEFGEKGEMESRQVIGARLQRDPKQLIERALHLLYELLYVRDAASGEFAAVRDQTAIAIAGSQPPSVVVHLSHILVAPAHRGSGLAGWMRAWPIVTARKCAAAVWGESVKPAITLVAEMEHPDPNDNAKMGRLIAYEKAGFLKVDPTKCDYWQPDFRDAATIDRDGVVRPIPMGLVLRRVGRETETNIAGSELRQIVNALYGMYGSDFRSQDMQTVYEHARTALPADDAIVSLVAPTKS